MNCHSIAGEWPPEPWHSAVPPYVTSWRQATTSFILKKRTVLTHGAAALSLTLLYFFWGRCEFHLDSDLPFHAPQILNFGSTLSTVHVTCHTAVSFPLPPVSYFSFKMQIPATLTSLFATEPVTAFWILGLTPVNYCYGNMTLWLLLWTGGWWGRGAGGEGGGIVQCNCSVL